MIKRLSLISSLNYYICNSSFQATPKRTGVFTLEKNLTGIDYKKGWTLELACLVKRQIMKTNSIEFSTAYENIGKEIEINNL